MTDSTVTLEEALKLLSLPRVVGIHPDDNEPITTNFGRFGPYVKHGDEFRSLESEDDVFNISVRCRARAVARAEAVSPATGGAEEGASRAHGERHDAQDCSPDDYGPYVTDGTTNASIPKTMTPEALTYAQADELLAARRDAAPCSSSRPRPASRRESHGLRSVGPSKAVGASEGSRSRLGPRKH